MNILLVTTGSHVTVYAVASFAAAVRNAGHELVMATNEPLMEAAEVMGIPAVSMMPETIRHFLATMPPEDARSGPPGSPEEMRATGRALARMTSTALDSLLDLTEGWSPDLVVGTSMSYAAGLLAARLEVPYVRYAEYLRVPMADIDPGAEEGLASELKLLGLEKLPEPDHFIDVTPPSLGPEATSQPMRHIPRNPQRRLEPWMFTRPKDRPRVLVTSGTHHRMLSGESLRYLVDQLTRTGAEVLVAAPGTVAEELGPVLGGDVRIGWIPLDVVAPTCDLAVNHGGATTAMTFMAAGVPQMITPPNVHTVAIAQALTGWGAALTVMPQQLDPGTHPAEAIAASSREMLSDSRHTERAQALAKEMAALPTPSETVRTLEKLAGARAPGPLSTR